jgi:hypothetical protein
VGKEVDGVRGEGLQKGDSWPLLLTVRNAPLADLRHVVLPRHQARALGATLGRSVDQPAVECGLIERQLMVRLQERLALGARRRSAPR